MSGSVSPVVVPLNAVAYQAVQVPLSGQQFALDIQQRGTGVYMSITMNGIDVIDGVLCQDRTWIVRRGYFGLPGDFTFVDTMGTEDPTYTGFGSRFVLFYQAGQNVG